MANESNIVVKADILDQGIQRFAISGLSKERYDEAVAEEILVDKKTGEFLLNTRDEVLISNDAMARYKASFDNAVWLAKETGLCGNIYQVEIDDIIMPANIPYNTNILNENIMLDNKINRLLFNFDLNEYIVQDNKAIPLNVEGSVKITMTRGSEVISVTLSLTESNVSIIDLSGYDKTKDIIITEIKFIPHTDYVGIANLILHNVFLTINM